MTQPKVGDDVYFVMSERLNNIRLLPAKVLAAKDTVVDLAVFSDRGYGVQPAVEYGDGTVTNTWTYREEVSEEATPAVSEPQIHVTLDDVERISQEKVDELVAKLTADINKRFDDLKKEKK